MIFILSVLLLITYYLLFYSIHLQQHNFIAKRFVFIKN